MDQDRVNRVNDQLVLIFNEILEIQERVLKKSRFSDLTLKEMHTIEAIAQDGSLSSNQVAKNLKVTPGTLTVAIQGLEKKGYVKRVKSDKDRRVVLLQLTDRGQAIYQVHKNFHQEMVEETLTGLDPKEVEVLTKGLNNLQQFLLKKK
ncbi:Uncharacterized HTH-type transcriptional regulator yusO [Alloiococcus otitis]|uniref:HTH marR-type domain-containing protein n=1 Tax=Alloiococcus otitis ATCC 51267 TaxID=883081 RepID=K9EWD5_9LACT|nr:MarR family transcriptional regulator [Alloiococcus otitis]EKU93535.1 hypothetical protein HMPREF9698_00830 [Alloiococcus otitis ATCC 51267]SUU80311.1 Uncharacterized HTH-type transcriptional regulator yusO [Alloiococcus otitis]